PRALRKLTLSSATAVSPAPRKKTFRMSRPARAGPSSGDRLIAAPPLLEGFPTAYGFLRSQMASVLRRRAQGERWPAFPGAAPPADLLRTPAPHKPGWSAALLSGRSWE